MQIQIQRVPTPPTSISPPRLNLVRQVEKLNANTNTKKSLELLVCLCQILNANTDSKKSLEHLKSTNKLKYTDCFSLITTVSNKDTNTKESSPTSISPRPNLTFPKFQPPKFLES